MHSCVLDDVLFEFPFLMPKSVVSKFTTSVKWSKSSVRGILCGTIHSLVALPYHTGPVSSRYIYLVIVHVAWHAWFPGINDEHVVRVRDSSVCCMNMRFPG